MRSPSAVVILLLLALPLPAADAPKPNTLTAKEIEDGWLLLFDGETTFGWSSEGAVMVENGSLVLDGMARAVTTTAFGPCELLFESRSDGPAPSLLTLQWANISFANNVQAEWQTGTFGVQTNPLKVSGTLQNA